MAEQVYTLQHLIGAGLAGLGAGLLIGRFAFGRKPRRIVLYVPEGFELSSAPPEVVDLALWRTRKVVAGV